MRARNCRLESVRSTRLMTSSMLSYHMSRLVLGIIRHYREATALELEEFAGQGGSDPPLLAPDDLPVAEDLGLLNLGEVVLDRVESTSGTFKR